MGKALLDFIPAFPVLSETERKYVTKGRFSRGSFCESGWSKGFATCLAAVEADKHFLDAIPRNTRLWYKIFVFNLNEQMRKRYKNLLPVLQLTDYSKLLLLCREIFVFV